jgi:CBS domain-containing protein
MVPLDSCPQVRSDATLCDALLALEQDNRGPGDKVNQHTAVLVRDGDRRVVGKLSLLSILAGLQSCIANDHNLVNRFSRASVEDFVKAFRGRPPGASGSLDLMVREADRVRVRDVMVPIAVSIDEDANLEEAIYALTIHWTPSILVTREGTAIGILRLADVFAEMAEHIVVVGWPDRLAMRGA